MIKITVIVWSVLMEGEFMSKTNDFLNYCNMLKNKKINVLNINIFLIFNLCFCEVTIQKYLLLIKLISYNTLIGRNY